MHLESWDLSPGLVGHLGSSRPQLALQTKSNLAICSL